jgi:hypothetical protein
MKTTGHFHGGKTGANWFILIYKILPPGSGSRIQDTAFWKTCVFWGPRLFVKMLEKLKIGTVLRIQTPVIRIRLFNLKRIRIRLFDTDPDPYYFKEVMYLKQYFLYIFTWFSLSGPTGPTQKVFFVKFSLPVNFVVPLE